MDKFTSDAKILFQNQLQTYEILSNIANLEKIKDKIPKDRIQNFSFDEDSFSFFIKPLGKVRIFIIERIPPKVIKFSTSQIPIKAHMWIQLVSKTENETKMKLTIKANINPFLKPILFKQLQEGINRIADILASIPYNEIVAKKHQN